MKAGSHVQTQVRAETSAAAPLQRALARTGAHLNKPAREVKSVAVRVSAVLQPKSPPIRSRRTLSTTPSVPMSSSASERNPSSPGASEPPDERAGQPAWVGYWRVRRYDGDAPSVPTYYDASLDSWDVIKAEADGMYVAAHPILEVRTETLVLKDEGAADRDAERWRVDVADENVRVVAETGPHAGAVGIAERIEDDPRDLGSR